MKFIFFYIFCFTLDAFGWGELGHQTVAEIAQRHLTAQAKQAIESIMGPEPLAVASIWPDIVKGDKRFNDFSVYHYTEVPPGKTYQSMKPEEHAKKDAYTVLTKFPAVLVDTKSTREQKMIALRYIVHVVGDIHQPLHVGNGKDRGGNFCEVIWIDPVTKLKTKPNLHALWDDVLIEHHRSKKRAETKKYYGYDMYSDELLLKNEKVKELTPLDWIAESAELRDKKVYPSNPEKYCSSVKETKSIKDSDKPVLSQEYFSKAQPVIEKQLIKAGFRLAALLNKTFENTKSNGPTDLEILKSIQITND